MSNGKGKKIPIHSITKYLFGFFAFVMLTFTTLFTFGSNRNTAYADTGNLNDKITWELNNGVLKINGAGYMPDYNKGESPFNQYSSEIKSVEISDSIYWIGKYTFYNCSALERVTLPSKAVIREYAFYGCSRLKNINASLIKTINEGAFMGCSSLQTISLASDVKEIAQYAFKDCTSLEQVTLTDSVTYLREGAFANCSKLEQISLPKYLNLIGRDAFNGCSSLTSIVIPRSVSEIGYQAFTNCNKLAKIENLRGDAQYVYYDPFKDAGKDVKEGKVAYLHANNKGANDWLVKAGYNTIRTTQEPILFGNVTLYIFDNGEMIVNGSGKMFGSIELPENVKTIKINEGVTEISDGVFMDGKNITEITIPNTVNAIGDQVFKNCTSLEKVILPYSLEKIGEQAFMNCSKLSEIKLPLLIKSIEQETFKGCTSLRKVEMQSNVTVINEYAFQYCSQLAEVTLSTKLQYILDYAFNKCTNLADITIPSTVTLISYSSFQDCTSLTRINMLTKSCEIRDKAFMGCTNLQSVVIPADNGQVDKKSYSIGKEAFKECRSLTNMELFSGATAIWDNAFENCLGLSNIVFSSNLKDIYKYAFKNCSNLASITYDPYIASFGENVFDGCSKLETIIVLVNDSSKEPNTPAYSKFNLINNKKKLVMIDQKGNELSESDYIKAHWSFKRDYDGNSDDNYWCGVEIYTPYVLKLQVGDEVITTYECRMAGVPIQVDYASKKVTEKYSSEYLFCAWYTNKEYTGTYYQSKDSFIMPKSDTTLYARLIKKQPVKEIKVSVAPLDNPALGKVVLTVDNYVPNKTYYCIVDSASKIDYKLGDKVDTSYRFKLLDSSKKTFTDIEIGWAFQVVIFGNNFGECPLNEESIIMNGISSKSDYRYEMTAKDFICDLGPIVYDGKAHPVKVSAPRLDSYYNSYFIYYYDSNGKSVESPVNTGTYEVYVGVNRNNSYIGDRYKGSFIKLGNFVIKSTPAITPSGLSGEGVAAHGLNDGKIRGTSVEMEYRFKDDTTYTKCSGTVIEDLPAGIYYVRVAATKNYDSSNDVEVEIKDSKIQLPPSSIGTTGITAFGEKDGTITGTTEAMEYKSVMPEAGSFTKCKGTSITGLPAGKYLVRYAAKGNVLDASVTVEVEVAPSRKQNAPAQNTLSTEGIKAFGDKNGSIIGTTEAMEYKPVMPKDGRYTKCSYKATTGLAAGDYLVRYAAKGSDLDASADVTVNVADSKNQNKPSKLGSTGVTAYEEKDGTITGTTEAMEYKPEKPENSSYQRCKSTSITGLVPGIYLVRYAAKGNDLYASEAVKVEVADSKKRNAPKGLSITVTSIEEAEDGAISGTTAEMEYKPEGGEYQNCKGTSITGLKAGKYFVRYAAKGNDLEVSDAIEVNITVAKSYTVDGVIKVKPGEVYAKRTVSLHKASDSSFIKQVETTDKGIYTFAKIPDGSYYITIERDKQPIESFKLEVNGKDIKYNIEIAAPTYTVAGTVRSVTGSAITGSAVSGSAISGSAISGSAISGSVVSGAAISSSAISGSAISGAVITLSTTASPEIYKALTDDNGYYTIHKVPNGKYSITVTKSDIVIATDSVEVKNNDVIDKDIKVVILQKQDAPTGLTAARVSKPDAKDGTIKNTNALMEYKPLGADDSKYASCDNNETTGLTAGTYLVRYAAKEGYMAGKTATIVIDPAEEIQPPITLTYSVSGTVKYANSGVISAAVVKLTEKASDKYFTTVTDSNGAYTIKDVTDGYYTITITVNDKAIATGNIMVKGDNVNNNSSNFTIKDPTPDLQKQDEPTGLTATRVSKPDAKDGTIKNTNELMEYKPLGADDSKYASCGSNETTGLAAGTYLVRYAAKEGYMAGKTATIVIEPAEKIQSPITLTYSVSGTVKYANSGVISAAVVTLTNKESGKSLATKTDSNGAYTINEVTDGHYAITITVNNKAIAEGNIIVKGDNVNNNSSNFTVKDPKSETPDPKPETPDPKPEIPDPKPETPDPKPETPNSTPGTSNPTPGTSNPTPETPAVNPKQDDPKKPEPKIVKTEEIKLDVKVSDKDSSPVIIPVQRTTDSEGNKRDTAIYNEESAKKTIQKLKEEGKNIARITLPDENNEIKETNVKIPTASLETIAEGKIDLEIATERAKITIPKATLQNANNEVKDADSEKKEDVFFNLSPIEVKEEKDQIIERAKQEKVVKAAVKDGIMTVVGTPMVIETNMPQSEVEITLPINTAEIPADKAAREKFLSKLAVFIEHSDGEMELVRGEVVDYKDNVLGIKFKVKKFSTFTILQADNLELKSKECEINKVTSPKGAILNDTKLSLTVKNPTKKVKVDISVSEAATWKLYRDAACRKEIKNKYLVLKTGNNKAYIKVLAEDGTVKVYTITVLRKRKVADKE